MPPPCRDLACWSQRQGRRQVLTHWLADADQNRLPPGPAHFVGVAGLVLNERDEVPKQSVSPGLRAGHSARRRRPHRPFQRPLRLAQWRREILWKTADVGPDGSRKDRACSQGTAVEASW
jgi:hypothetical protein